MTRYLDISEMLLRRIADGELPPGAALPSVRAVAREFATSPATVGRAYAALARAGAVRSAPRRAARVSGDGAAKARRALHAGAALQLAGSDDPLLDRVATRCDRIGVRGSFGGLGALWQRSADAATLHLQQRNGSYNAPFAARVLAGRDPLLVHLWRREQGIIVAPSNPAGITGVHDLIGRPIALRANGTGTRVLLARLLREAGQDPLNLRGPEVTTHLEAAIAVAAGHVDAAVGLRAAADTFELDFIHLAWEPFELALPAASLPAASDLLDAATHAPPTAGYDVEHTGTITALATTTRSQ